MKKYILLFLIYSVGCFSLNSCGDFLDEVPKGVKVPKTIGDYRAFLSYQTSTGESYHKGYISNEFVPNPLQLPANPWNTTHFDWITDGAPRVGEIATDFVYNTNYYGSIYRYNLLINEVPGVSTSTAAEAKEAKQIVAQARVQRAFLYFHAVNSYAKAYNPATADTERGIPYIATHDDFESPIPQVSVGKIYEHILADLDLAIPDLPSLDERYDWVRPSKASGYALRARVHLFMQNFDEALKDADAALQLHSFIFDMTGYYQTNVLDVYGRNIQFDANSNAIYGLPQVNFKEPVRNELILFSSGQAMYGKHIAITDPVENENMVRDITMFDAGDTRFITNFWLNTANGTYTFRRYDENTQGSIKTSEMHLIRAECYARAGDAANLQKAMTELNTIRVKRIMPTDYLALTATTKAEAMRLVQRERQVELMFSDMLFYDLRRFNTEPEYAVTLKKKGTDGVIRTIAPNSEIWVLPFANDIMSKNTRLEQNTTL